MKRDEIKVGEDYLVGTHHTWSQGHYRNAYVRVIDTTRMWFKSDSRISPGGHNEVETDSGVINLWRGFRPDTLGRAKNVLVQHLDGNDVPIKGRYDIYHPQYFRRTALEGKATIAAHHQRMEASRKARQTLADEQAERMASLKDRAKVAGISVSTYGAQVAISADEFERLLERLDLLSTLSES